MANIYISVDKDDIYSFYYNMTKAVNGCVGEVIGDLVQSLPRTNEAQIAMEYGVKGGAEFGVIGQYNKGTGNVEYDFALDVAGITAVVNEAVAEAVLARAIYYCPKDTGYLASTGKIVHNSDGTCSVVFDCTYAWFVHEQTWKRHKYPEQAKFLTIAIQEVQAEMRL